jgi:tetratricopeptide (TPR) repeat protein
VSLAILVLAAVTPRGAAAEPPAASQAAAERAKKLRELEESLKQMDQENAEAAALVEQMRANSGPTKGRAAARASTKGAALSPDELCDIGEGHLRKGEPDRAIEAFKKARALDASSWLAVFGLGAAYDQKGDHKKSLAMFQEVLRRRPQYSIVRLEVAEQQFQLKRYSEAAANFRDALAQRPEKEEAESWSHYGLSLIILAQEGSDQSNDWMEMENTGLLALRKAVTLEPQDVFLQADLALGFHLMGRTPQALEVCGKVRELDEKRGRACVKVYGK